MDGKLDIIGDVHGDLAGLRSLGRDLGYRVDESWRHPDERHLVFLGDLVDGGRASLEVAELVMRLVTDGLATCLMGNHEYNLLEAWDLSDVRKSGRKTFEDSRTREARWAPVLQFFRTLPLAIETSELRLVHAVWDATSLEMLAPLLRSSGERKGFAGGVTWWRSPFTTEGLLDGLPTVKIPESNDRPHAVVMKGLEIVAPEGPFIDVHEVERTKLRECWWEESTRDIPRDKVIVFGHYHHLPPVDGHFTPPFPFGTRELAGWSERLRRQATAKGRAQVPMSLRAVCVDLDDGRHGEGWVGAFRWPEREVVWAGGGDAGA